METECLWVYECQQRGSPHIFGLGFLVNSMESEEETSLQEHDVRRSEQWELELDSASLQSQVETNPVYYINIFKTWSSNYCSILIVIIVVYY